VRREHRRGDERRKKGEEMWREGEGEEERKEESKRAGNEEPKWRVEGER
jgi:hypothetical protein